MNKSVVVILGAGASSVLGFPLQVDLWGFLTRKHQDQDVKKFLKHFQNRYGNDIEEAFTILESAIENRDPNLTYIENPDADIERVKFLINQAFSKTTLNKVGKEIYKDFINKLVERYEKMTFVDLNWDVGLESILKEMGVPYWHAMIFDNPPTSPIHPQELVVPEVVTVLKPHGSLNWWYCSRCKRFFSKHLRQFSGIPECWVCQSRNDLRQMLVMPSFNKRVLAEMFNSAARKTFQSLSEADILIFIGYGLREADYDMRYLLSSAIASESAPRDSLSDSFSIFIFGGKSATKRIKEFYLNRRQLLHTRIIEMGYFKRASVEKLPNYLTL